MATILFIFNMQKTSISCKKEDKMKDICNIFLSRYQIDINSVYFIYNGNILNLDLTFDEQANSMDKERNEMNILVNEIQKNSYIKSYTNNAIIVKSKQIICPICDEDCRISIKDYKINLYDCKNNHRTENLPLDEFNNTQFINESKIICEICTTMSKNKADNSGFYKCIECQKNVCPICRVTHNNNHNIIDYNKKNLICNIHNIPYCLYCYDCKNNLCEKCENKHYNHNKK